MSLSDEQIQMMKVALRHPLENRPWREWLAALIEEVEHWRGMHDDAMVQLRLSIREREKAERERDQYAEWWESQRVRAVNAERERDGAASQVRTLRSELIRIGRELDEARAALAEVEKDRTAARYDLGEALTALADIERLADEGSGLGYRGARDALRAVLARAKGADS